MAQITSRLLNIDIAKGWPLDLGVKITPEDTGPNVWTFGAVNGTSGFKLRNQCGIWLIVSKPSRGSRQHFLGPFWLIRCATQSSSGGMLSTSRAIDTFWDTSDLLIILGVALFLLLQHSGNKLLWDLTMRELTLTLTASRLLLEALGRHHGEWHLPLVYQTSYNVRSRQGYLIARLFLGVCFLPAQQLDKM